MEKGDVLLGTVREVTNTVTTVSLPDGKEGTLVSSEIAPGRIKHMRHYVVPNKKIVIKILELTGNHIHLSLRRVNSKEKKEVMQKYKQNQAIKAAFKQILGESYSKIREKIRDEYETLFDFITEAKENEKLLQKFIPKDKIKAIKKISEKRQKSQQMVQNIKIKCLEDNGVNIIKKIFDIKNPNVNVTYISAGNFKLKLTVEDFKTGKKEMSELIEGLEKKAKKNNCEFTSQEEK